MSPSENMEVDARDTERMAAAGAWKAEADSRRARATTAADCMTVCRLRKRERRGVSAKRWQRGRAEGAERAGCGARAPEKRMAGCGAGGVGREGQGEGEEPRRLVCSQRTEKWCGLDRRSAELFIDIIKHANNKDTNKTHWCKMELSSSTPKND